MATNIAPTTIVNELLRKDNYATWSACIRNYLLAQDLWDVVESPTNPPQLEEDEASFKSWRKKNAAALHVIQVSCSPEILGHIKGFDLANSAWDTLASMLQPRVEVYDIAAQEAQRQQFHQFLPLSKAIGKGDLNAVKDIIRSNPYVKHARNPNNGMTALHLAIYAGHGEIAEELMQGMTTGDLEVQDSSGYTYLCLAALTGDVKVAKSLVEKNGGLLYIANSEGFIPLVMACARSQIDVTHYLYSTTPIEFLFPENGFHGNELLVYAIMSKMFDIALDLVLICPRLVLASSSPRHNTMLTLSRIPSVFYSSSQLVFWQRWIYPVISVQSTPSVRAYVPWNGHGMQQLHGLVSHFLEFIGIKQLYDAKLIHVQVLQLLQCMCKQVSMLYGKELKDRGIIIAINEAVRQGVTEIIVEMIRVYPDIIGAKTSDAEEIFISAIVYRQENIFNLIYGLDSRKYSVFTGVDSLNNTMLHMAGMLAPFSQLTRLSGAALQMQRELQWFKEVESLISPTFKETRNQNGETPSELFTRSHKQLLTEGEKWMKDTATSFTVVGALIITIMFAAAFSVPGGNNQEIGLPIFINEKSFKEVDYWSFQPFLLNCSHDASFLCRFDDHDEWTIVPGCSNYFTC
ncbi:uncharacterized protein LOC119981351 isoform X2 [Tripterygium wilfordii]|uniref:uncharacterized protein LOC119981351 isoform X2 n=1 Tax=Tripterygium wilfordii TaxID=458696 RepID=UPI0018F7F8AA|nr:uncharacterized protein LOC119981351 isoform X2 [Tripterygium wilfordii]